jgi:DNA-binding CsgD family transcriptional regulator
MGGVQTFSIRGVHTFNEPDTVRDELAVLNNKYSAQMEAIAAQPGLALRRYTPSLYDAKRAADMQDYIRRYHHEQNLLIADLGHVHGRGEWLSLYRSASQPEFTDEQERALTVLMPHLVEALTINRKLALGRDGMDPSSPGGMRALVKADGTILYCGSRFSEWLSDEWLERRYTRLPPRMLASLQRDGKAVAANGTVVVAKKLGHLLFLAAKKIPRVTRLSGRERTVIQLYAQGKSYKEIAQALALAPATIRNFIQNAYRKLGVTNKSSLIHLLRNDA